MDIGIVGIFLEFMCFFALLVSAQSCQGHTEAGSLTLDTRVAATIFRAAAVGSELGHTDRFAKFSRTKKD